MRSPEVGGAIHANQPAAARDAMGTEAPASARVGDRFLAETAGNNSGQSETSDADVARRIRTCWECCVPIQAILQMLKTSAPKIAPTVLAAYTPPTSLPGSCPFSAT